jgi:DNA sulfur modification protein DndD
MKIKNIIVENFQSYFEKNRFEFKDGVNLILGENGGGKSSLFNAFYWVLFDKVYETDKGWSELDVKFFNARSQKLLKKNELGNLSVLLSIKGLNFHKKNSLSDVLYTFSRKVTFKKTEDNIQINNNEDLIICYKNELGETIFIDDNEVDRCIDFLLPSAIRDYIWFQGETISELIDFNNADTLSKAIDKISYFPHYKSISEIVKNVTPGLTRKINTHITSSGKKDKQVQKIISEIEYNLTKIKSETDKLSILKDEKENLNQFLSDVKLELRGISDTQNLADEIKELNIELNILTEKDKNKLLEQRSNIINKWMLKGIDPFILSSEDKIKEFIEEIRLKSKNDNPIPEDVPGSIYIEQMLVDEKCHICMREAPKDSPAYKILQDKLGSSKEKKKVYSEKDKIFKNLEHNFMSLVNIPKEITNQVKMIDAEIEEYETEKFRNLDRMKEIYNEKKEILKNAGIKQESNLTSSAQSLRNLLEKQENINEDFTRKNSEIKFTSDRITRLKLSNSVLEKDRDKLNIVSHNIPEQTAKPYFDVLEEISRKLEDNAKESLINEIENKSSELLHGYLESSLSFKGRIVIDRDNYDVGVTDSQGMSVVLNSGNLTAAKMSVINSILYLSSEKLQKSYPLVSDAPSSVFDAKNTKSYMNKIGETFPQVIIMTKDIYNMSKEELKSIKNVNRVYRLVNRVIDSKLDNKLVSNFCTINGEPII